MMLDSSQSHCMSLELRWHGCPQEEPLSIHLPGVKQKAEKMEAKQKEATLWQSRIVVEDTAQHFHRLLPQTEMTYSGFYSSNQVGVSGWVSLLMGVTVGGCWWVGVIVGEGYTHHSLPQTGITYSVAGVQARQG